MKRLLAGIAALAVLLLLGTSALMAQGVTTSSVRAVVRDPEGNPLAGARVSAVHTPSGTSYAGTTSQDGRVVIPGMRIGGPYEVAVAAIGFERQVRGEIYLTLGVATDLAFEMRQVAVGLSEIVVTAERVFSSERTGAATTVGSQAIQQLPTVLGRIEDFTRLTPQARGTSFVGQDNRLNNITVDGSYFNNSFGLGGQPGDRTGVAPISMDAIEQIQVNIAPY
ncbi:MAG TPA: carboxypeptidase-like regulatory domain-containing protein, partial [Gemmatimonadales bacterium]|nr:carboxypeptidase-like regulatory domain-containing protein [Gemmatimonadales bacterium]